MLSRKNTPIFLSLGNKKCCCRADHLTTTPRARQRQQQPDGQTEKRTIDAGNDERGAREGGRECVVRHVTVH